MGDHPEVTENSGRTVRSNQGRADAPVQRDDKGAKLVRIFDRPRSLDGYSVRDFLTRSVVQFESVELHSDADALRELGIGELGNIRLPVVELPDGERLFAPHVRDLAARLGWIAPPRLKEYDLSIYGAGPAGLSAAVYAASEGLRAVVIEKEAIGGQAGTSSLIENYMGFPNGISGGELAERARQQAVKFGIEFLLMREGVKAEFRNGRIHAQLAEGGVMVARANICATGVEYRRLGLPNENAFLNRGVYYGAGAGEAPMCRDEHVIVVGGGNSAGQAVMHFSRYARAVTMAVRGANLAASLSQYLARRVEEASNVTVRYNSEVTALHGDDLLRQIALTDHLTGEAATIETSRLFVCIGGVPNTEWAKDTAIMRDKGSYLITGPDLLVDGKWPECWPLQRPPFFLETSVPGSFAAGDVRHGSVKRVASAVGEGAMAVTFVHRYLGELSR
jgi:thioredoxin reductase (NADPH)